MQGDAVHKAATILGSARLDRRPVHPLPDDCRPASLPEAYDIQAALHALRGQATGDKLAGYKIGCTTPVMQQLVGVDAPAYGGVFAADVHAKAAAYRLGDFQMPGIECEIAVRLGSDLDPAAAPFDRHSAAAAIEACMAAMEVVDNRYGDFKAIGAPAVVADDFFHDSCVIGEAAAASGPIAASENENPGEEDEEDRGRQQQQQRRHPPSSEGDDFATYPCTRQDAG